jgi:hypothetical protein
MEPDDAARASFKASLTRLDHGTVDRNIEAGGYTGWRRDAAQTESARRRRYAATMPGEGLEAAPGLPRHFLARTAVRVVLVLALAAAGLALYFVR